MSHNVKFPEINKRLALNLTNINRVAVQLFSLGFSPSSYISFYFYFGYIYVLRS